MDSTSPSLTTRHEAAGLDIGVGASCIYPLLACASRPKWRIYGTDIDATNFQHAIHNVSANELDARIKLIHTAQADALIPMELLEVDSLDFTMCNPPFFASKEEASATFLKDQQPFAACTGADVEMITPGGEVDHVSRMVNESIVLKQRVQWYTAQLGKLSSLHAIVQQLKDVGCRNWAVHVLQPSGQTVRWALGWSWTAWRAPDGVARHKSLVGTNLQMEPNEQLLTPDPLEWDPQGKLLETLNSFCPIIVSKLDGRDTRTITIVIRCDTAVWSRSARRKREREEAEASKRDEKLNLPLKFKWDGVGSSPEYGYIFAIDIKTETCEAYDDETDTWSLNCQWVKGEERAVFESFCGMLKRKITSHTEV
jgi:23S rRNA (adenine1618-N6)-methyltransferase